MYPAFFVGIALRALDNDSARISAYKSLGHSGRVFAIRFSDRPFGLFSRLFLSRQGGRVRQPEGVGHAPETEIS